MKEKNGITVLLPVHELDDVTREMFNKAVKSVSDQTVQPDALFIIVPKGSEVAKELSNSKLGDAFDKSVDVRIIENDGKTDFSSQINFGVEKCETEWFSILELDDEYSKIWFKCVEEYKVAYDDVDVFLPIIIDVTTDKETGNSDFVGLTNEAVWAQSFCDEMGVLDNGSLLAYQNFNIDGMVMKTSLFDEFGGLKPSIKLTFIYELLLRLTEKSCKVFVIPKWGYKHVNQREGSLFHSYRDEMNPVEAKWWLEQAKKESFHPNDRGITYETEIE